MATMPRIRTESAARWRAALHRALAESLDPLAVVGVAGAFAVESGTCPGVAYLVTGHGLACTCPAGQQGDPWCKHRAAVLASLGRLPQEPALPTCRVCDDRGDVLDPDGRGAPERCCCTAGCRAA